MLDDVYQPRLPVDSRYHHYFEPTRVTDELGELNPELADDLMNQRDRFAPNSDFIPAKIA